MGEHKNSIHLQRLISSLGLQTDCFNAEETIKLLKEGKQLKTKTMATSKTNNKKTASKEEQVFPEGIALFNPHENAPDFVLGKMIISKDKLQEWLDNDGEQFLHDGGKKYGQQLKLDILKSKSGDVYVKVDTYGLDK